MAGEEDDPKKRLDNFYDESGIKAEAMAMFMVFYFFNYSLCL